MTQQQYIISRKVNIVELANTLGNISEACRRSYYYFLVCIPISLCSRSDGVINSRIASNTTLNW